ncbi:C-type lectin domain family 4 member F isoform X3 [Prionailurus iriomotensis]
MFFYEAEKDLYPLRRPVKQYLRLALGAMLESGGWGDGLEGRAGQSGAWELGGEGHHWGDSAESAVEGASLPIPTGPPDSPVGVRGREEHWRIKEDDMNCDKVHFFTDNQSVSLQPRGHPCR